MLVNIAVILLAICYLNRFIDRAKWVYKEIKKIKISDYQRGWIGMIALVIAFIIYLVH